MLPLARGKVERLTGLGSAITTTHEAGIVPTYVSQSPLQTAASSTFTPSNGLTIEAEVCWLLLCILHTRLCFVEGASKLLMVDHKDQFEKLQGVFQELGSFWNRFTWRRIGA